MINDKITIRLKTIFCYNTLQANLYKRMLKEYNHG